MTTPLLIYPGEVGHLVEVNDILEERHRAASEAREADIATRTASGTPLDGLEPLPGFERDRRLDGIRIQVRALSERERRSHEMQEAARWRSLKRAQEVPDEDVREHSVVEATDRLFDQRRAFLLSALEMVEIDGPRGGTFRLPDMGLLFDVLERSQLFTLVFVAAVAAQEMPAGKAWRSGRPPASTLSASSAGHAQSIDVRPGAATAAHEAWTAGQRTSPANGTRPTPAHGGT